MNEFANEENIFGTKFVEQERDAVQRGGWRTGILVGLLYALTGRT